MGKAKETTTVDQRTTQQVTPQPTAEETRLNQLAVQREEATQPGLIAAQMSGLELVRRLLEGSEALPGTFQSLAAGISPEVTSSIVSRSLEDITPSFQQAGLLDSGVRASVSGRIAGDIRRASEEFNIGNRLNLLNLALSGQAQVQQPILGFSSLLSQRLAGLRSVTSTGTTSGSTTTLGMNPFLKSFQESLGRTLGSPRFSAGPVSFGG